MEIETSDFDCRHIDNGRTCISLSPWNTTQKGEINKICTCTALNVVIFAEYHNEGKVNEELINISPVFDCPIMQALRIEGKAPHVEATITKNEI